MDMVINPELNSRLSTEAGGDGSLVLYQDDTGNLIYFNINNARKIVQYFVGVYGPGILPKGK